VEHYVGSIGPHSISVYLEDGKSIDCDRGGSEILGYYYYVNNKAVKKIRLKGYNCGASFTLTEFDGKDNEIALFSGIIGGDEINGKRTGTEKEFDFLMTIEKR